VTTIITPTLLSILAVLETFVYDPLINWRLVEDLVEEGGQHLEGRHNEININKKAVEILQKVGTSGAVYFLHSYTLISYTLTLFLHSIGYVTI